MRGFDSGTGAVATAGSGSLLASSASSVPRKVKEILGYAFY